MKLFKMQALLVLSLLCTGGTAQASLVTLDLSGADDAYNNTSDVTVLGMTAASLEIVRPRAYNPNPPDGWVYVSVETDLSWLPGDCALSHNVYMSVILDDLNSSFLGNTVLPFFELYTLHYNTRYFWRIDEVCSDRVVTGNIWYFYTEVPEPGTIMLLGLGGLALAKRRRVR